MPGLWEQLAAAIPSPSRLQAAPTEMRLSILNKYKWKGKRSEPIGTTSGDLHHYSNHTGLIGGLDKKPRLQQLKPKQH
jgi:hypothetical protein